MILILFCQYFDFDLSGRAWAVKWLSVTSSNPTTTLGETIKKVWKGRGGGQVVSVLASYSDDLISNPTEVYSFFCKFFVWNERK